MYVLLFELIDLGIRDIMGLSIMIGISIRHYMGLVITMKFSKAKMRTYALKILEERRKI